MSDIINELATALRDMLLATGPGDRYEAARAKANRVLAKVEGTATAAQPPQNVIAAAERLLRAVRAEMSPGWTCNSYHPTLAPAADALGRALAADSQKSSPEQRAAFEAWASTQWPGALPPNHAWMGWQARAAMETPVASREPVREPDGVERIWQCKIGGRVTGLPPAADGPMREALQDAFARVTGHRCEFVFSGWGATLREGERAVHEGRTVRDDVAFAELRAERDSITERLGEAAATAVQPPMQVTAEMVTAYLEANDAYWRRADEMPRRDAGKWRNGTPREATAESLRAALAAATAAQQQPDVAHALGEAVAALHFDDNSHYASALWTIVLDLGGREAVNALQFDSSAAYHRYGADRNASPQGASHG
ncbi:hypothetical protein [Azohydromonas lata]|uniref:hypothetical protein n=1 Tax=Azohydromonas lata TaxID=45677 RepID=UPI000831561F|nr:hypothetical protein [Azohydromonas lata]